MPSNEDITMLNQNIATTNSDNIELIQTLQRLKNKDSGAGGELLQKNFLYNQLYAQNIVMLVIILGLSGVYLYKRKS